MMNRKPAFLFTWTLLMGAFFLLAAPAMGSEKGGPPVDTGWSGFVRGGYVHQLDTDIDDGGSFSVNRFFIQGGPSYFSEGGTGVSLSAGYGYDGYDFSGSRGFGGRDPWDDIHSVRFSVPVRWKFAEYWTGFVIPTIRYTGESGADFSDALSGGGFAGFTYRFSDSLTIGPGVGVLTQLEDSTRIIPVLIINWKITDTLSLNTGRGTGATLGPGLTLDWKPLPAWTFSIGGRYESLRFRLDDDGAVPDGVGSDRSFPIFGGVGYRFTPNIQASLIGGVEVGGELRLEDENGHTISKEDHDAAGFFGFSFSARF